MTTESDGIPEDRPCYRCGKNPAEGFASVWTAETGERWYCHGDDDESPTCYEQPRTDAGKRLLTYALLGASLSNPPASTAGGGSDG